MSEPRPSLTTALEHLKANTKDFPAVLKISCAVDALAIAIYYCHATYYSLPAPSWDALSDQRRDVYRTRASAWLDAMGQAARVYSEPDLSRELFRLGCALNLAKSDEMKRGKKIAGTITPQTPWGEGR